MTALWSPVSYHWSMATRNPAGEFQYYIAQAINAERGARGYTNKRLQEMAKIPDKTWRRAMASEGTFDLDQLGRICTALAVPMSQILRDAERRQATDPDVEAVALINSSDLSPTQKTEQIELLRQMRATTGTGDSHGNGGDIGSSA